MKVLFFFFFFSSYSWINTLCLVRGSEILNAKPHFVFIFEVEDVLLYTSKGDTPFTHLNCEALEFLDWAIHGMPYYGYDPELYAWTATHSNLWVHHVFEKLATKCVIQSVDVTELLQHLTIVDGEKTQQLRLRTNGINDWGKFRRQLYSYEELHLSQNTITFFFTASFITYGYNICSMQQYLWNSVAIFLQHFNSESVTHANPVLYYAYFVKVGGALNPVSLKPFQTAPDPNNETVTTVQRFHDVRRILESIMKDSDASLVSLNLLQRANTYFTVPSLVDCPYDLMSLGKSEVLFVDHDICEPERIYAVVIIDLKPIQQPGLPTLQLLDDFIRLLWKLKHIFLGQAVQSLLFHCHPIPDRHICTKIRTKAMAVFFGDQSTPTDTATPIYPLFQFFDVVSPKEFAEHQSEGIPKSAIEAVEYSIASRLPRQTTIVLKMSNSFPQDLNDGLHMLKKGGYQVCYSNVLAHAESAAEKARWMKQHSVMKWLKATKNGVPGSSPRSDESTFVYVDPGDASQCLGESNQTLLKKSFLGSRVSLQCPTNSQPMTLEENPLTRLEFLSDLTMTLGFLKRIQMRTDFVVRITSETAYEAALMFQKSMGTKLACYSFFEY